ncbi:hypothetical protein DPEC_G00364170 [Dallia pectoralis]|nr:hypothetical protein DPEC_G00364170 [Dallia pectoralis]
MLTSKTMTSGCTNAYTFCLEQWDELSLALIKSQDSRFALPGREELSHMQEHKVLIRLALMADFYRYQKEDLCVNKEESTEKLHAIRGETFRLMTEHGRPLLGSPRVSQQSSIVKVAMGRRDPGAKERCKKQKARPFGSAECESKRVKVDSQDETNGYDDNGTVRSEMEHARSQLVKRAGYGKIT